MAIKEEDVKEVKPKIEDLKKQAEQDDKDELAALDALEKEASEFNKVTMPPTSLSLHN